MDYSLSIKFNDVGELDVTCSFFPEYHKTYNPSDWETLDNIKEDFETFLEDYGNEGKDFPEPNPFEGRGTTLILLHSLPYSGKSEWIDTYVKLYPQTIVLNSECFDGDLYEMSKSVYALFKSGNQVVLLDYPAVRKEDRDYLLEHCAPNSAWLFWFQTTADVCVKNAETWLSGAEEISHWNSLSDKDFEMTDYTKGKTPLGGYFNKIMVAIEPDGKVMCVS